jgi:hypothetical protein
MKRLVAVVVALALWCGSAWAAGEVSGWDMTNPGGGGLFSGADYDLPHNGTPGFALIGTDVGGMFQRIGDTGKWTPIGYFDGIYATHVRCVRFVNNTNAVAATDNGVYYSTDHGATWNRPTFTYNGGSITGHPSPDWTTGGSGNPVTTIGTCRGVGGLWSTSGPAQDSSQCYIAFHSGSTNYFAVSTDGGASFDVKTTTLGGANDRVIKIIVEGQTHGSSQIVFAVLGWTDDNASTNPVGVREIHKSVYLASWTNIVTGSGITGCEPIDITVRSDGSAKYLVSFENTSGSSNLGPVYVYDRAGNTWTVQTGNLDDSNGTTGAVFSDGSYYYVIAKADPSQNKDQTTDCGTGDFSCAATNHSGLWRTALDNDAGWTRIDNGTGWDRGWANCVHARGQTNENMANTVGGRRHFWVSAQHVWKLDAYDAYRAESDAGVGVAGNEANSNRLDNAECIVLGITNKDSVLAGYYDMGLWQKNINGWISLNGGGGTAGFCADQTWTGDDYLGGNVNGIATDGSDIYVTEAVSSKNETTLPWRVWKRNPTTGVWTKYAAPPNPNGDAYVQRPATRNGSATHLTGLCISGGTITSQRPPGHASTSSPSNGHGTTRRQPAKPPRQEDSGGGEAQLYVASGRPRGNLALNQRIYLGAGAGPERTQQLPE